MIGEPLRSGESPRSQDAAIWVNGERRAGDVHVSARDRGFTLADGVFETMRVRHGRVFRLDRHLARLRQSLAVLHIPAPERLDEWVHRAVRDGAPGDAAVRLTVTRGPGAAGLTPPANAAPTVVVTVIAPPSFPASMYQQGLTAVVASGTRNERAMTAGLKTLAYTDNVAALLEAQRAGTDEALFLDTDGHCSEATASNLFLWTGRVLLTPPVTCGALPGITRETILELAPGMEIETAERAFGLDDLLKGHEAFLTSSLRGIVSLVSVNDRPVGSGVPGGLAASLAAAHAESVERECGG